MGERTITCSWCQRRNRVPEGALVEARCGRCESPLTYYTWFAPALRGGAVMRTVQYVGAAALLAVLLGPPLLDWLETDPIRLHDRPSGDGELTALRDQIAGEAPEEPAE